MSASKTIRADLNEVLHFLLQDFDHDEAAEFGEGLERNDCAQRGGVGRVCRAPTRHDHNRPRRRDRWRAAGEDEVARVPGAEQ